MARIAGVDLPREKRAEIGLTYIYGIGKATANEILAKAEIDPNVRIKDLSEEQVNELRKIIDNDFLVEGDLRREIALNIKRLRDIKCYRGMRHAKGLPLRGQRTKTNASVQTLCLQPSSPGNHCHPFSLTSAKNECMLSQVLRC